MEACQYNSLLHVPLVVSPAHTCLSIRILTSNFILLQVEGNARECEESCRCMCEQQGIQYLRLSPLLRTAVNAGERDDKKLLDMLWTTRKYMIASVHYLEILKQFFINYVF